MHARVGRKAECSGQSTSQSPQWALTEEQQRGRAKDRLQLLFAREPPSFTSPQGSELSSPLRVFVRWLFAPRRTTTSPTATRSSFKQILPSRTKVKCTVQKECNPRSHPSA